MSDGPAIGQIGLGLLGGAIALRLRERGWRMVGYDANPKRLDELAALGIEPAQSPADVVRRTPTVILCLPTSDVVADVIAEVERHLSANHLLIDTTTGSPQQMAAFGTRLAQHGASYLDACVLGSSAQARAGQVVLTVGGTESAFAAARELLGDFSIRAVHAGPGGSGARFKLVHNLVLGLHRAVLAEALVFAERMGLDSAAALELLSHTPAASAVMTTKGPKMQQRDFAPQATVAQHLKDVCLMLDEAQQLGLELPLSTTHRRLLENTIAAGLGHADNTAIITALEGECKGENIGDRTPTKQPPGHL